MMKKIFAVLAMTAGCIAWAGAKEKTDSLAEISGKILYEYSFYGAESLQDAYNANIMIVTNGTGKPDTLYTSTNLNGIFTFKKLVPQKIFMRISRVGSKTISGEYEIEAGQNAFFFTLEEAPERRIALFEGSLFHARTSLKSRPGCALSPATPRRPAA